MSTITASEAVIATEYDALTGLQNHQGLTAVLSRLLDAPDLDHDIGALLLLDVDHFHVTNEMLGRAAGDQLLRNVAAGLRSWANGRCVLARTGADEFAIALTTESGQDFRSIATDALAAITAACMPHPPRFSVGVSNFDLAGRQLSTRC